MNRRECCMIKLIALDLDGTLLDSEKHISEENKKAITLAKAKGVKIVLCSGRPLKGIQRYLEELDLMDEGDYSITYNGGLVQKNNTSEIVSEKTLSYDQIKDLYKLANDLNIPMNMLDLEYVYEPDYPAGRDSLYPSLMSASLPFIKKSIDDFTEDHRFNKVVYCISPDILDDAIAKIPADYTENYSMMKSRPLLYEVMNPQVNKGTGIDALCQILGITKEEVMACGDEENDFAMFEYAGTAVVMENARDEVKAYADFITKTNDEDGIAHAIYELVL